ncbi:MAG: M17 family peptidase N-terminal domain-containing protein, partial [Candidatus Binatia bacterium]
MTEVAVLRFDVGRGDDVTAVSCDLLVVPVRENDIGSAAFRRLDRALGKTLGQRARAIGFRGQEGRSCLHRPAGASRAKAVLLVGLGKAKQATSESWRRAGAAACSAAAVEGARDLAAWI